VIGQTLRRPADESEVAHVMGSGETREQAQAEWQTNWGRLLRTARQVAGLSLADLSAATGLSKGYLSKLESGHATAANPSRATLAALARALPSFGPLAHILQPQQLEASLALGLAPPTVPAFLAGPSGTIRPSPVRLGWRELEAVVALMSLESSAAPYPLTALTLARATQRPLTDMRDTLERLVHMGVVVHRAPSRAGGDIQYLRAPDFVQRVGIARIGDALVLAAALLAQSPLARRRATRPDGLDEDEDEDENDL
jgi:transcriptional regulator with XRE-family HTH domain